jgi:hypothetical protein
MRTCFSFNDACVSPRSSSAYADSPVSGGASMRLVGRRETTLTFQNFRWKQTDHQQGKMRAVIAVATDLVDHVTFWMPALVAHVPIDLHELLQNCGVATRTFCRKARRIMIMAVHVAVVFIIRVLWPEKRRTYGAREMLDVELSVCMGVRWT